MGDGKPGEAWESVWLRTWRCSVEQSGNRRSVRSRPHLLACRRTYAQFCTTHILLSHIVLSLNMTPHLPSSPQKPPS
jgi:hypothetical protein